MLPGLVNGHTHLELSWLEGRVPPQDSMDEWIGTMMRIRRKGPAGGDADITSAIRDAITAIRATGTVLVGDISNTLASVPLLDHANLAGAVFHVPTDTQLAKRLWPRLSGQPQTEKSAG